MRRLSVGRRAVVGALMVVAVLGVQAPAEAAGQAPLVFTGTATLPKFPCALGDPACVGTFGGTVSGELAGSHFNRAWTATLAQATLSGSFTYADTAANCSAGVATGTVTLTAGDNTVIGTYGEGSPLPRLITALTATVNFSWLRVGTSAQLSLSGGSVVAAVSGTGNVTVMSGAVGQALAGFVPMLDADDLPDCVGFAHSVPITAAVAGTAVLAQPGT